MRTYAARAVNDEDKVQTFVVASIFWKAKCKQKYFTRISKCQSVQVDLTPQTCSLNKHPDKCWENTGKIGDARTEATWAIQIQPPVNNKSCLLHDQYFFFFLWDQCPEWLMAVEWVDTCAVPCFVIAVEILTSYAKQDWNPLWIP